MGSWFRIFLGKRIKVFYQLALHWYYLVQHILFRYLKKMIIHPSYTDPYVDIAFSFTMPHFSFSHGLFRQDSSSLCTCLRGYSCESVSLMVMGAEPLGISTI